MNNRQQQESVIGIVESFDLEDLEKEERKRRRKTASLCRDGHLAKEFP